MLLTLGNANIQLKVNGKPVPIAPSTTRDPAADHPERRAAHLVSHEAHLPVSLRPRAPAY